MEQKRPLKLLLVDFLDSYSHNIPAFIRQASRAYNIEVSFEIEPYIHLSKHGVTSVVERFNGVILSPGPGTVDSIDDIGEFAPALLAHRPAIPIFGVCLGFQAICKAFGATIERLTMPHHGLVSEILDPSQNPLGRRGTRYHSLQACMNDESLKHLCPQAIAPDFHDNTKNALMEVAHRSLPFWGVQYHPESVYSVGCDVVVQPFLQAALARSKLKAPRDNDKPTQFSSLITCIKNSDADARTEKDSPPNEINIDSNVVTEKSRCSVVSNTVAYPASAHTTVETHDTISEILWKKLCCEVDCLDILLNYDDKNENYVLLDSSNKGDWDILACASTARRVCYSLRKQKLRYGPFQRKVNDIEAFQEFDASVDEMWDMLEHLSSRKTYCNGPAEVPFWGGFIGYFGYELGLARLGLDPYPAEHPKAPEFDDLQLNWSTETVLYRKSTQELYLISLKRDHEWLNHAFNKIVMTQSDRRHTTTDLINCGHTVHPEKQEYIRKIEAAQEELKAGNSYEICLTASSDMFLPMNHPLVDGKEPRTAGLVALFSKLRSHNPAEFMCLLKMDGLSFMSASPEEFLTYDVETRLAKMKPIKGTLAKEGPNGEKLTIEDARNAFKHHKVVAENLMIADLVRNDLSKVSDQVTCPNLLCVEEIETMYQLVSTIEAVVKPEKNAWHLLKNTLPPGSMTGAPKRRSCQILQNLEQSFRGLYSGVVGYVDVRGNCRTSVSIRNAVQYPGESHWRVGAGGAITNLSDPEEEWRERQLKSSSISRVFTSEFEILETALWDPVTASITHIDRHVERLIKSSNYFGFKLPANPYNPTLSSDSSDDKDTAALAHHLRQATLDLAPFQQSQPHRLSFKLNPAGNLKVDATQISDNTIPSNPVNVYVDPCSTNVESLQNVIVHKTTHRDHYNSARGRVAAEGRDEVLLFRPAATIDRRSLTRPESHDDVLTEGSYTNVAVYNEESAQWITPADGCLPGIQRQILLDTREVVTGDVRRRDVLTGSRVMLFNSVRGVFEGCVV